MEINKKSGFYGYTIDTTGELSDINGTTDKCLIVVSYNTQTTDIDVEVSNGVDDWAILTGDGETIPVSNPEVIFTNRSNSIVQFTLNKRYPSNSPCFLVFRSDTAYIHTNERLEKRPFEPNMMSGHFGFTSDNGNNNMENGLTNEVQVTIPFPLQKSSVEFFISEDPSHWGIRVGDGSIIPVHTPQVLFSNLDNGVVKFTMTQPYPSNSPVVLVYRSKDAYVKVSPKDEEMENIPVTNIRNIPDKIFVSERFDLKQAIIEPSNATNQHITWSVISGNANINENILVASSEGDIKIKAAIMNDTEEVFVKTFSIYARKDRVSFIGELQENIDIIKGQTIVTLSSFAVSDRDLPITYQWLVSKGGAFSEISGANKFTYEVPNDTIGTFKYKCRIKTQYADPLESNVCTVNVFAEIAAITFQTPPAELRLDDEYQFKVLPDDAERDRLNYTVSNPNISSIDKNGKIKVFGLGETIVTATYNGRGYTKTVSHTVTVKPYVAVTDIQNLITEMEIDTDVRLTCTIVPTEAASREVQWVLLDRGTTEAVLNGNNIRCRKEGIIRLRCVIKKGYSSKADFIKDFSVKVSEKFIPVQNINIEPPAYIEANKDMKFKVSINPSNATNKLIGYEIQSASGVTATSARDSEGFIFNFSKEGNVELILTIKDGISKGQDYVLRQSYTINKNFVPVTDIINVPLTIENVKNPHSLFGTVLPVDASFSSIQFSVKKAYSKFNARVEDNKLKIDTEIEWWKLNENPKPDLSDQYIKLFEDPIIIEARIRNGLKNGVDFVKDFQIGYVYPNKPNEFVSMKDIKFDLTDTNLNRAFVPIPLTELQFYPANSTKRDVEISMYMKDDPKKSKHNGAVFKITNGGKSPYPIYEKYPKNLDNGLYMILFENFDIKANMKVKDGVSEAGGTLKDFEKEFDIEVRSPFIPINIDQKLEIDLYATEEDSVLYAFDYLFNYFSDDNYLIRNNITTVADISTPTYLGYSLGEVEGKPDVIKSIIKSHNTILVKKDDIGNNFKSFISVPNGIMEEVKFKSRDKIAAEHYTNVVVLNIKKDPNIEIYKTEPPIQFKVGETVKVVGTLQFDGKDSDASSACTIGKAIVKEVAETGKHLYKVKGITGGSNVDGWINKEDMEKTNPNRNDFLIKLTLKNNEIVKVKWFHEISLLSTYSDENSEITIGTKTFKKKDVLEVEFWDDYTDLTVPTSLKLFGYAFTSLRKISPIPKSITGDECLMYFLGACENFNQPLIIPENVLKGDKALCCFLQDCKNFNSNISFEGNKIQGSWTMAKFLSGCQSFNKELILPDEAEGQFVFYRLLEFNYAFNSNIKFPSTIKGYHAMDSALFYCVEFNKNIILPRLTEVKNYEFNNFMFNCVRYVSEIQISHDYGKISFNSLSFSTYVRDTEMISQGIKLTGSKANTLLTIMENKLDGELPLRNLKLKP